MGVIKSGLSLYFALAGVNTTLYGFNRDPLYKVPLQSGAEEFVGKNLIGGAIDGAYAGRHATDKLKPQPPFSKKCPPVVRTSPKP